MKRILLSFLLTLSAYGQHVFPPAAGGGSGTVTSIATGCGTSGGTITTTGTIIAAEAVRAQTTTSDTFLDGDCGKLVTHTNGGAIAVTLPQANGSTFKAGWFVDVQNRGAGTVTITPTTSTIDGAASLTLLTSDGVRIVSDGTNYFTQRGRQRTLLAAELPAGIDAAKIGAGGVSSTEFGYLDGVTSALQGQLDGKSPGAPDKSIQYRVNATTFNGMGARWDYDATGDTISYDGSGNQPAATNAVYTGSFSGVTTGTGTTFYAYITVNGTPDSFKWAQCDWGFQNCAAESADVPITGSAQLLADSISITFSSTTGNALNALWDVFIGNFRTANLFFQEIGRANNTPAGKAGLGRVLVGGLGANGSVSAVDTGTGALTNDGAGALSWQSGGMTTIAFASLSATDGVSQYCSDCTVTSGSDNTCAASGGGAMAVRIAGASKCFQ